MASANMSWIVARRLAALVVTTGLLLPAIRAATIDDGQRRAAAPRNEVAGNDFDNSIPTYADMKPTDSVDEASGFLIRCYCNMPACLAATGGVRTCTTRLGCFSQLLPNVDGTMTRPVSTTTTPRISTLIPEEFDVEAAIYANDNALNGAYGCLDLLPINKTCDEVLKLMESEESEFPIIRTGTSSHSTENTVSAYHCCEEDMCNDRSHVAASATNAEASLIAAFEKSRNQKREITKTTTTTTVEPEYAPIAFALVSGRKEFFVDVGNIAPDVFPNSDNTNNYKNSDISLFEAKDITTFIKSTKNMVSTNRNKISSEIYSNDNSKTPLFAEVSHKENNVTSPSIGIGTVTTTTSKILNASISNTSEVIVSDSNSTLPTSSIITVTTEDINISKIETKKQKLNSVKRRDSPRALAFHNSPEEKTTSVLVPFEAVLNGTDSSNDSASFIAQENDSRAPMNPSLNSHQKVDGGNQNSVTGDATQSTSLLGWTGIPQWVEGVTGILAICGVIGVTVVALATIKIIRNIDVFDNYKSVCSNPGQPCACNGGLGRRRSRQLTSSSTVYRNTTSSIQPVLPPPNNSMDGFAYIDSTGNSTHVYTQIPVPL